MTKGFLDSFEDYFICSKTKYFKANNVIWQKYNQAVIPVGPAKLDYSLNSDQQSRILSEFNNVFFIRSNNGFNHKDGQEKLKWYAVIKKQFIEKEKIKSNESRKKIKRGLINCKVEKIDADFIAHHGYEVFYAAVKTYKGNIKFDLDEKSFCQKYKIRNNYPDIFHYWGVFEKNKLIGYAENLIYNFIESSYSTMKFLPEKFDLFPTYALVYSMDEYYLQRLKFEYVNDGFRSILHETNIQDFLIKNFHFYKQPTSLNIYYKPAIEKIIKLIFPFKNLINNRYVNFRKINALLELEEIRRDCQNNIMKTDERL
ncbi:MAG: hypothetical protein BroJett005_06460 [Ignavibacteriota bacterium]|nr:MAG: hypothetical protein BroJett005_06460 [Ignavibacteriota bacterium]